MSDRSLAVVTGASSGIGEAYADALADRGHHVLAVARRADRLAALAARHPGQVDTLVADLTAPGAVDDVLTRAGDLGPVELLVSNAGRGVLGPHVKTAPPDVRQMLELNVMAGVEMVTRLLPGMLDRDRGGIVLVSSSGAYYPVPNMAAYGGTKAFLLSFAESLAVETNGTKVRVMALCPGPTVTEFGGLGDMIKDAPGSMTAEAVVAESIRAFGRGRTVCVPGTGTRVITKIIANLPRPLRVRAVDGMFAGLR